ncbi:DUF1499 domain-containing protein [Mesorhizobium xinjiangense]|uniref:DUF1499 domain-containing protein n=1 Tax=Mesorhizobium xinjiangense TaxID=2678685 RepID=UPI0012ED79C0|nr:DUF1499 domain-containing protein [Mesorhizobium xinjiangense]
MASIVAARFIRGTSRAAVWSVRTGAFALVLFVISAAGHRFGLIETRPFLVVLSIVCLLGLAAFCLAAAGFVRLWETGDRAGRNALAGAVMAALVLAPFGYGAWRVVTLPRISDISTDSVDPPALAGRPASPDPRQALLVAEHYPQINGRRYSLSSDAVAQAALQLIAERGWAVVSPDGPQPSRGIVLITVEARSAIFGFPSDVALRISDEGETSYVDMRSASRYGAHDLGENAARISRFLADLDERATQIPVQ